MSELPVWAWRALHSCAVESVMRGYAEDPQLASLLLWERVGPSLESMGEHLAADLLRVQVAIDAGTDAVHVRLLARADDDQFVGICHPRGRDLGMDENTLAVVARAEAAAYGIEPRREQLLRWEPVDDDEDPR